MEPEAVKLPDPFFVRPDFYFAASTRVDAAVSMLEMPAPARMDGLTALFVSDIHLCSRMDADAFARLLADQHADLVLMGGDYAESNADALRLFRALSILKAPLGIFAVCGNNDVEAFDSFDALADAMSVFGAQLLVNRTAHPAKGLCIGGIDEFKYGNPDCAGIFSDADEGDFRILLSHYPLASALESRPDLMLSGHTHGGQFNGLGLTPYAIGFERIGKGSANFAHVSGVKRFGPTTLLVSKGVGGSRIPLRIGVRPEIHRIVFRGKC